jgi:hypothetical protein
MIAARARYLFAILVEAGEARWTLARCLGSIGRPGNQQGR